MVVGAALVTWLTLSSADAKTTLGYLPAAMPHINVGLLALLANIVVMAALYALIQSHRLPPEQPSAGQARATAKAG